MRLFYSPTSPYVRKVMITAFELELVDKIERLPAAAHPINRDQSIVQHNPLGKVPTLITDDGQMLYDSRVICEYLDHIAGGGRLFPAAGPRRWAAIRDQSLGDGILDAALLVRYEGSIRAEQERSAAWTNGQMQKIHSGLAAIEADAASYADRIDIGTIAIGCVLGYLDFRFAELGWRASHPQAAQWFAEFAQRASFKNTAPPA